MSIYAYLLSLNSTVSNPQFDPQSIEFINTVSQDIRLTDRQFTLSKFQDISLTNRQNISKSERAKTKSDSLPAGEETIDNNSKAQASESSTSLKLNPESDPLLLPTKPEQVKVDNLTPLTLQEAIALAEANNRQLSITRLELESAEAAFKAEKAAWFPTLSTQTTFNRSQNPSGEVQANIQRDAIREQAAAIPGLESQLAQSNDPLEQQELLAQIQQAEVSRNQLDSIKNFGNTGINGSVGLQFTAFSPQRSAAIKIAREQANINRLEVNRIRDDLRLQVSNAYYDLQQNDRQVEIAQNDVETRLRGVEVVERLLQAALATRLDLLNARVELDNALQILRNAKAQRLIARRNIAQILSLPENVTPITADEVTLRDLWNLGLEESIILALENRVELEQQLAQRRSGKAQVESAWATIKPEVGLFANYDFARFYADEPGDTALRGFGDGYSVGINFNWTIWDGGVTAARAKQARTTVKIAEQQFANNANQIRFEVEQAYYQLPAFLENVATADLAVEKAEAAVEAARTRFKANLNTQTEVLDAQNRLVQAENNQVQAILDYNRAFASLQRAVGGTSQAESDKRSGT